MPDDGSTIDGVADEESQQDPDPTETSEPETQSRQPWFWKRLRNRRRCAVTHSHIKELKVTISSSQELLERASRLLQQQQRPATSPLAGGDAESAEVRTGLVMRRVPRLIIGRTPESSRRSAKALRAPRSARRPKSTSRKREQPRFLGDDDGGAGSDGETPTAQTHRYLPGIGTKHVQTKFGHVTNVLEQGRGRRAFE